MADTPKKKSPLLERTGSLTGDLDFSTLANKYKDYALPAAAALAAVPVVGKFGKPVAKALGKEAARRTDKYMTDTGLKAHIVKPEGGQWESDSADRMQRNLVDIRARDPNITKWLQTTGRKYLLNRAGSPSDEIRLLADEGITHLSPSDLAGGFEQADREIMKDVIRERVKAGYPNLGVSNTDLGSRWELRADAMIQPFKAEDFLYSSGMKAQMPWLEKVDPKTPVYGHMLHDTPEHLGMDKLADALRHEMAAGRLRPEQLNKVSIGDAVKLAHQQRLVREAEHLKNVQALPKIKEYPEKGMAWHELTHEDPQVLDAILKQEGDVMQNCIGGYCSDVVSDGTRLFSLRDAKGQPHVNIEVRPEAGEGVTFSDIRDLVGLDKANELFDAGNSAKDIIKMYPELLKARGYSIRQIKGKQNYAPIEDYVPYVQDFIKNPISGKEYFNVGDLHYTGMMDANKLRTHGIAGDSNSPYYDALDRIFPSERGVLSGPLGVRIPATDMLKMATQDLPGKYVTQEDILSHLAAQEPRPMEQSYSRYYENLNKPEGFAEGGLFTGSHDEDYDNLYEFVKNEVNVRPSAFYRNSENQGDDVQSKMYTYGADVDLLNKMGIGADVRNVDVKYPGGRYKQNDIGQVRGYYNTDDGIQYSASFNPNDNPEYRSFALRRSNPEAESEISLERTPRREYTYNPDQFESQGPVNVNETPTTWLKYTKRFAKGGEVDYDSMYEFK